MEQARRDHGGGIDAAATRFGGTRADWIDLSTGINPVPDPVGDLPADCWTALPDAAAHARLDAAARGFWQIPERCEVVVAPGASALIARLPALAPTGGVHIPAPTYNEHAAAFAAAGFWVSATEAQLPCRVIVHPNNPGGRLWRDADLTGPALVVVDESFAEVTPGHSLIRHAARDGVIVLKSFGKFWGLAGLRLGFAICAPDAAHRLREMLGPWPVSGPALAIATRALSDPDWTAATRARLAADAIRLDRLLAPHGTLVGGTDLFRLYDTPDAAALQHRLAQRRIWSRTFPYSTRWIRLGLPGPDQWDRLGDAL